LSEVEVAGGVGARTAAGGTGSVQGAGRVVALAVEQRIVLAVGDPRHGVAGAVADAAAPGQVDVLAGAIEARVAVFELEAAGALQALHVLVAVVVLVGRVACADAEAFELGVEHEVDDARDRVGAVHGRRTTGQDVDAVDQGGGDDADVAHFTRSGRAAGGGR
jgi:hypothetical protein